MPVPPRAVRDAARRGLELRRERRRVTVRPGGTAVGVARARDLVNGRDIPIRTMIRMRAYFDRVVDSQAEDREDPESPASVAFLLWGGRPGYAWVKRELERRGL
jgi:hypothetical protein